MNRVGLNLLDCAAEADRAIEQMVETYQKWAIEDIEKALALVMQQKVTPSPETVRSLFFCLHDIKGQGGTFGFDLVSEIGAVACNLIRNNDNPSDAQLDAITQMLVAIRTVLIHGIRGEGGAKGQRLVELVTGLALRAKP